MVLPAASHQPFSLAFNCTDTQSAQSGPTPAQEAGVADVPPLIDGQMLAAAASVAPVPLDAADAGSWIGQPNPGDVEQHSVQLRNLPSRWSRGSLLELLDSTGFKGKYR